MHVDLHLVFCRSFIYNNKFFFCRQLSIYIHTYIHTSRAQFKYALRIAKRNEETARADALARDLYDKDLDEFWSSVRQLNRNSSLLSNCIDGVTGEKNISNYWKEHFL